MFEKKSILGKQRNTGARDTAATWFLRLRENDVSEKDFAEWRNWLAEDKVHEREFDEIVELWGACDQLEDMPWSREGEIETDNVLIKSRFHDMLHAPINKSRSGQALLATSFLFLTATLVYFYQFSGLYHEEMTFFETTVAEHRTVKLEDGSVMVLGAKTNISVRYDEAIRFITLHQGEAYFEVHKDKERPFVVVAGQRSIRAIGTAFNINMGAKKVSVTVVEGLVRIEPVVERETNRRIRSIEQGMSNVQVVTNVSGGHGVVYDSTGVMENLPERETETAISWQGGRLVFVDKPLDSVIADINRYSSREIVISDDELDDLRYTGTVFQSEISGWLQGLDKAFPIRVIDLGDHEMVVIARKDT